MTVFCMSGMERQLLRPKELSVVSSMLKLSSLKPSKYTRWILASIGRLVTSSTNIETPKSRITEWTEFQENEVGTK